MKVLILENDEYVRRMLAFALAQEGAEVVAVECCGDALRAMEVTLFDVAVVDLGLGGVDGVTCAEQLKVKNRLCKFYAYTAYPEATHPDSTLAPFDQIFRKATDDDRRLVREVMNAGL